MDGCCLYIEAIAKLRSHVEMKMSSWCFFCRSKAPSWSLQAQLRVGEGAPSLFPVPLERGQGLPHPQLRKWHRPPTSHSEETPGRPMGEAAKQRASEPHLFTHLSLARASMKIWCIFKSYTAIKWRELLVVDEPSPLACVAHNIFGESPVQFVSQNMKSDLQLTLEDESGTKDHEPMLKIC